MTRDERSWRVLQQDLQQELDGTVSEDDGAFPEPFNARFAQVRPRAMVRCATAPDVAASLASARHLGLPTAVRGGGHCFGGHSSTAGLLIDLGDLDDVRVAGGEVTVQAGARLGAVGAVLDEHHLALPAGTCPTVGIAGLTLGGGLGILGRRYGLTSDRLRRADVVLADGTQVTCDAAHHPDLFWALRGAGAGNLGVVTSLTFAPVPVPATAENFHASWTWDQAAAVIDAWQRWAPAATDSLAASLKITAPRHHDGPPPRVDLYASLIDSDRDAARLLAALTRAVGHEPREVRHSTTDYPGVRSFWANLGATNAPHPDTTLPQQPETAEHLYAHSEFFAQPLPPAVIQTLLAEMVADPQPHELRELDFMPWGGAYAQHRPDHTAFVHRDDAFLLKTSVAVPTEAAHQPRTRAQGRAHLLWQATQPVGTGRSFQNFADPDLPHWAHSYYGSNLPRLQRIKARYDPDNLIKHPQSIPPE